QTAAVVASAEAPAVQPTAPTAATSSSVTPPATPTPQPTVIEKTTILTVPSTKYVTHDELTQQLGQLRQQFAAVTPTNAYISPNIAAGGNPNVPYASVPPINQLTNVTVSGVSGLKASDIPALNYLSTTGGAVSGNFGIGTTSPFAKFSAVGSAYLGSGLSSTGVIVPAAPYATVASGAANFGPSSGETSLEFIDVGHILRIRQNGTVTQIKIYIPTTTGITGFYFKIWRQSGSNFDLVGSSANLASSLVAGQVNTISLPSGILAAEGDYVGARVEYSGASVQNFYAATTQNTTLGETGATLYSVTNTTPSSTSYNWTAQTATTNKAVLEEVDMAAPIFVTIGDSITSGLTTTASFADNYQLTTNVAASAAFKLGHSLGYTYQNMGIGGQTTSQMSARFTADVVNAHPKFVVILGGVNDILGGVPNTTIVANITSMLDAAIAAGITPVVIGVTPFRGDSLATNSMLQQRDLLNASLKSLVTNTTYNGYYVNADPYIGQFYNGGDANNLWQLQPIYDNGDHIHPNPAGQAKIAQAVSDAINQINLQSSITAGDILINGDTSYNGDTPRFLGLNRSSLYNSFGSALTLSAGGASAGSIDQQGGDLILQSGVATGVGSSSIRFQTPTAGTTGATDTPMATVLV
ncbi:MAG TPA: GDSL-type esterase/lipase family protein, partial [Candidatus Paceibacterota bacterium]